jgi:hypothetical protein
MLTLAITIFRKTGAYCLEHYLFRVSKRKGQPGHYGMEAPMGIGFALVCVHRLHAGGHTDFHRRE